MVLVSFNNIYIWQSYGKNDSAIFGPIELKFLMGTQETIIYRLAVRNQRYDAYLSFLIFGLGSPNPTKMWQTG